MADYTLAQLATAAKNAGFSGTGLVTAIAVSLAEDGSMSLTAENHNTNGSTDRGPWQINNFAHPNVSDSCAFNLDCAAQAAYSISSGGTNWTPWTTFTGGAYKQYLGTAQSAAGSSSATGSSTTASTSSSAISLPDIGGAISGVMTDVVAGGTVVAGGALILGAILIWVLWSNRREIGAVAKTAAKVV